MTDEPLHLTGRDGEIVEEIQRHLTVKNDLKHEADSRAARLRAERDELAETLREASALFDAFFDNPEQKPVSRDWRARVRVKIDATLSKLERSDD